MPRPPHSSRLPSGGVFELLHRHLQSAPAPAPAPASSSASSLSSTSSNAHSPFNPSTHTTLTSKQLHLRYPRSRGSSSTSDSRHTSNVLGQTARPRDGLSIHLFGTYKLPIIPNLQPQAKPLPQTRNFSSTLFFRSEAAVAAVYGEVQDEHSLRGSRSDVEERGGRDGQEQDEKIRRRSRLSAREDGNGDECGTISGFEPAIQATLSSSSYLDSGDRGANGDSAERGLHSLGLGIRNDIKERNKIRSGDTSSPSQNKNKKNEKHPAKSDLFTSSSSSAHRIPSSSWSDTMAKTTTTLTQIQVSRQIEQEIFRDLEEWVSGVFDVREDSGEAQVKPGREMKSRGGEKGSRKVGSDLFAEEMEERVTSSSKAARRDGYLDFTSRPHLTSSQSKSFAVPSTTASCSDSSDSLGTFQLPTATEIAISTPAPTVTKTTQTKTIPASSILSHLPSDLATLLNHSLFRASIFYILARPLLRSDSNITTLVARYIKYHTSSGCHHTITRLSGGKAKNTEKGKVIPISTAAVAPRLSLQLGYLARSSPRGPAWDALHQTVFVEQGRLPSLKSVEEAIRQDMGRAATGGEGTRTSVEDKQVDEEEDRPRTTAQWTLFYNQKLADLLDPDKRQRKKRPKGKLVDMETRRIPVEISAPKLATANQGSTDERRMLLRPVTATSSSTADVEQPTCPPHIPPSPRSPGFRNFYRLLLLIRRYRTTRGFKPDATTLNMVLKCWLHSLEQNRRYGRRAVGTSDQSGARLIMTTPSTLSVGKIVLSLFEAFKKLYEPSIATTATPSRLTSNSSIIGKGNRKIDHVRPAGKMFVVAFRRLGDSFTANEVVHWINQTERRLAAGERRMGVDADADVDVDGDSGGDGGVRLEKEKEG